MNMAIFLYPAFYAYSSSMAFARSLPGSSTSLNYTGLYTRSTYHCERLLVLLTKDIRTSPRTDSRGRRSFVAITAPAE